MNADEQAHVEDEHLVARPHRFCEVIAKLERFYECLETESIGARTLSPMYHREHRLRQRHNPVSSCRNKYSRVYYQRSYLNISEHFVILRIRVERS